MDLLKAEIERKRRVVAEASSASATRKKRYLKASELREIEERRLEEEELEELERRRRRRQKKKKRKRDGEDGSENEENDLHTLLIARSKNNDEGSGKKKEQKHDEEKVSGDHTAGGNTGHSNDENDENGSNSIPDSLKKLSPQEVTEMLRSFGLPVRFFGEKTIQDDATGQKDDSARLIRLSIAMEGREAAMAGESEKDEFRLESGHGIRNTFLERDKSEDHGGEGANKPSQRTENIAAVKPLTAEEENDPPKKIHRFFKSLLRQWEDDLAQRPESIRRTAAGRNETKTLKQCKDYIRPLFKLCKSRQLEPDLQNHIHKIVLYCEQGEFVKAHDSYMDVAIGRAAWPIGVTMVGIHARSGRAKIESANVAHVMNSELHRKYLTSVKRLMSYAQKKRVDVDPSKKVMNL